MYYVQLLRKHKKLASEQFVDVYHAKDHNKAHRVARFLERFGHCVVVVFRSKGEQDG